MKIQPLYHMAEGARVIVERLPVRISYRIAEVVGDGIFYFWPRVRRNMIRAVANLIYLEDNDPEVKKTARRCMRNFSKYIVDMFRLAYPPRDFLEKNVKITGRENLDAALSQGKGIILVSFHLGNLDLGIRMLGHMGYPVCVVVDSLPSGQLDAFLQKPRAKSGARLIRTKEVTIKMLDVLRRNEIVALMIDSPNCLKGVKVKLGQKWVVFPTGPAVMAIRTGAQVIPCGVIRTSNDTFHAIAGKPIEYQPSGTLSEDIRTITQKTTEALEDITRQFIDQWFVFHPLIKDELQKTES
jgi:Kdo2-lipid IVA lauroyltransferase/acyltransferase